MTRAIETMREKQLGDKEYEQCVDTMSEHSD